MINMDDVLEILPLNIRNIIQKVDNLNDLQEIRIKVGKPIIVNLACREIITNYVPSAEDIKGILQRMSRFSIYAYEEEIKQGFLTIRGGHRIGICGRCVTEENKVKTIKDVVSLNIRISKEIKGCSNNIIGFLKDKDEILNTIIISPPQCGKTTLLRDITYNLSSDGKKICVVDERGEIGACFNGIPQMELGIRTDILDNCPKSEGIMMAVRSMSPDIIVCDEIGTYKDMESLLLALNSGVSLISSIHGYGIRDLYNRAVFKEIIENQVFKRAVILSKTKGAGTIESVYDFRRGIEIWKRS